MSTTVDERVVEMRFDNKNFESNVKTSMSTLERLKKAAQLLKEGKCGIVEIAYMVGFSSPSYFSSCFKKQFGVLPKDFVQQ